MNFIKKQKKRKRVKELVFEEFQKSLKTGDYARSLILSKRFLKL
jgi:hypothetical protein